MAHLPVLIRQIRLECPGTVSLELEPQAPHTLAAVAPGSHVQLQIPGGPQRSYSLMNSPSETRNLHIAVKREPQSRGGSAWLHEQARVGQVLQASPPVNDFPWVAEAPASLFISGGIGLTPLLAMAAAADAQGRPWVLHHSARAADHGAFATRLDALRRSLCGEVHLHRTGDGAARLDLDRVVAAAPAGAHVYVCGPNALIDAVLAAVARRADLHAHCERFAASQAAASDGGFELHLRRSGRTLVVPAGKSILDVLLDADIDMAYACTQGVCGTCKVGVMDGLPDHRDECLSAEDKAANRSIITCCSGSRSAVLVLDV